MCELINWVRWRAIAHAIHTLCALVKFTLKVVRYSHSFSLLLAESLD